MQKEKKKEKYFSSKPRYKILDSLRGIAAIIIVIYHIFESYFTIGISHPINHGYLAVDFFFVLSGFVISYSYDDRWDEMSLFNFIKRRFIRLHPYVIFGTFFGCLIFYFQDCEIFPLIKNCNLYNVLICLIWGITIIPIPPYFDIRGWKETNPLNGVIWTLQFEYFGNFIYAILIRRISNLILLIFIFFSCILTFILCFNFDFFDILIERNELSYTVIGGWTLNLCHLFIGFVRLLYPFLIGIYISRKKLLIKIKYSNWLCLFLICFSLGMPFVGNEKIRFTNGIYDFFIIIFVFPLIVSIGAGSEIDENDFIGKICNFLGEISYPIYITHYPLIYVHQAYAINYKYKNISEHIFISFCIFILIVFVAFSSFKLYDEPFRKLLRNLLFESQDEINKENFSQIKKIGENLL